VFEAFGIGVRYTRGMGLREGEIGRVLDKRVGDR
jgi:hypothetical protein